MAQLSFKRYATTSSLNTAKAKGSLQEGNVVFDAELKILYIVTIKSGNIELEPYYGTNTTYTFSGDGTNTLKIKPSNANEQSITINNVVQAANATKATNDSDGNKISSTYLKLSGGTLTGALIVKSSIASDSITTEDLIVNGSARFVSGLISNGDITAPTFKGNLTGTADVAKECSGNSASANKLNTNAGSATLPVYFANGVPVAINKTGVEISITGNAATATNATNSTNSTYLGNSSKGYTYDSLTTILAKKSDVGHNHDDLYLKLTGGTINGNLTVVGASNIDDLQTGSLLVNGQARFLNEIEGTSKYSTHLGTNSSNYTYDSLTAILAQKADKSSIPGSSLITDRSKYADAIRHPDYHDFSHRLTSMNQSFSDGALHYFLATSSCTTAKPAVDSNILHASWDNSYYASQLALPISNSSMQWRYNDSSAWSRWFNIIDDNNWSKYIGTQSNPVLYATNAATANIAINSNTLNGYTSENLYTSPQDWMNKVGCVKTIIVEGDADKFYPVGIKWPIDKQWYSGISIYKNLGSKTPTYDGNHSNGTSSMWAIYEGRYTGWDGNGTFVKTIVVKQDYAPLIARADRTTYTNGYMLVWLRGGGCEYKIARTVKFTSDNEIKIGLDDPTNFESDTYKWNCSPIPLSDINTYNKGVFTIGYDAFSASYAENSNHASTSNSATTASKATLADSATKADYLTGFTKRDTSIGWGILKESNGFKYITDLQTSNLGDIAFAEKDTNLYVQIDGFFYQNEGKYRVIDQNNWKDYIGTTSSPVQNAVNATSVPWSGIQDKPNLVTLDTEQTISAAKTFNSSVNITSELNADSATLGNLIVNGTSKFLNIINGNLKGDVDGNAKTATSAITATSANKVSHLLKWGSKSYDGSSEQTITAADLGLSGAMHFLGVTTSNISEGSTLTSIIVDSKSVTPSKGDVVLYSHSEYIWTGSKWEELGSEQSFALKSVQIIAGDGLTGGGTLEATRTLSHKDTSTQASITTGGRTYINKIELDDFGHVTSLSTGTESDQVNISGNAGTATKAKQDWDGNEIASSYLRKKAITGIGTDYTNFVILLCSLDNTNLSANFYCSGTFFLKRSNCLIDLVQRIDVQVGKLYNTTNPVFASVKATGSTRPKLIKCTYNGTKYVALYFTILTSSYDGTNIFVGQASNLDDVKAVQVYNNNTKTVLNSEIYNSIEYIKDNVLGITFYGAPYVTYDGGGNLYEIISKYNISQQSVKEAVTASKLSVSAGSNTQPVYFKDGIPVAITGTINNTASNSNYLNSLDTRNVNDAPYVQNSRLKFEFKNASVIGISDPTYVSLLSLCSYADKSGGYHYQMAFGNNGIYYRKGLTEWETWSQFASKSDIPTKLSQLTDDLGDSPVHTHKQYALKAGDTITGKYKFTAGLESDSITTEDLIVNGSARFVSGLTSNANITATTFTGDLKGNADTATNAQNSAKADLATKADTVNTEKGTADVSRPIFFAEASDKTKICYDSNFTYNPNTKNLVVNSINSGTPITSANISSQSVASAKTAESATTAGKIASHTLWGQTFNGTQDVNGNITLSSGFMISGAREINNEPVNTNHTLCLGYSGHDYVEWKEYGGDWRFIQSKSGANTTQVLLGATNYFLNNVGIGNQSPAYKLDVTGTARITGDTIMSSNLNVAATTTSQNVTATNQVKGKTINIDSGCTLQYDSIEQCVKFVFA